MEKTPAQTYTTMTELVLSSHVNGSNRLFGGQLMSWMDIAGAICARRHSGTEVVTARVDKMEFVKPANPNEIIILNAKMTWVGNTSMEVKVKVYIEDCNGEECAINNCVCKAYFVYVAMDEKGNKVKVPRLKPETQEEIEELNKGQERAELRKSGY
ncbi:MAG: acyl-CoA thioesterase [Clostridiales bacterium]|nr:acyl-CoA thioesterase [Clostridiales bacterium]